MAYQNGARVRATSTANPSNWMEGLATYAGTTLTITVDKANGAGTIASWNSTSSASLAPAINLSDVANLATARLNLGIRQVIDLSGPSWDLNAVTNAGSYQVSKPLEIRPSPGRTPRISQRSIGKRPPGKTDEMPVPAAEKRQTA